MGVTTSLKPLARYSLCGDRDRAGHQLSIGHGGLQGLEGERAVAGTGGQLWARDGVQSRERGLGVRGWGAVGSGGCSDREMMGVRGCHTRINSTRVL